MVITMKRIAAIILTMALMLLVSCGETYTEAEVPTGEIIYKTVEDKQLGLEILMPTVNKQRRNPAVLVLHGGGWVSGAREDFTRDFKPLCDALRAAGISVIPVTYRLAVNGTGWRDCLDDCEDALNYIIENSKRLGIDEHRLGIIGYSAGGQLALMTAVETRDQVKYCVSMSGPTFFSDKKESIFYSESLNYYIKMIFPENDQIEMYQASPIIRVNRNCKSDFLLISGTADEVVKPSHAESFLRELESFGLTAELIEPEGLTHSYTAWSNFGNLCEEIAGYVIENLK